jgi:iron complex transport system substrate-binding protein
MAPGQKHLGTRTALRGVMVGAFVCAAALTLTSAGRPQASNRPTRIVSLIPAVTEMLFAIGAGPQLVAVSSFDRYPPEVEKLQRVGALLDPDLETILSLRPDLVVVYTTQTDLRQQLDRAKIPTYVYSHAGLADVTDTIVQIGSRVGHETEAAKLVDAIRTGIGSIRRRVETRQRPRVLVVFGREALALRGIYASGGVGFVHDMIEVAGGENVFSDIKRQAVQATTELILSRRPDVILELRPALSTAAQLERERPVWNALTALPAVRTGRVHFITDERTVVPGPRIADGVATIARALHPEAFR